MAVDATHKKPEGELVYVAWYRHKSGKIIRASDYGKKCFVFRSKGKVKNN